MLIEFSVANFRSIRHRQAFSLVKGLGDELIDTNVFDAPAVNNLKLLRSAAIYGPNAGGKSNLIRALQACKSIVLSSATSQQRGHTLPVTPFRLSAASMDAPSEFELTFIVDQVRYQYGFSATVDRICSEWLFAYPKGRPQRWFERKWTPRTESYEWDLGGNLVGEKLIWQKSTRANALFLSTAVQLNSQQLQPVYDWFQNNLKITGIPGWNPSFSAAMCEGSEKSRVMDFLRAADLDIADILVKKETFDIRKVPENIPDHVKDSIINELKSKEFIDIKTLHKTIEGAPEMFDFADESDGTRKLFAFAGPWIDSLANGNVLFIDELHDNLHPKLVHFLVQLFHNSQTNPRNAQLVFTTHETSILNQDVFRRDQVWFCEKDQDHATILYPLTDFSPRKGRENLELAYLSGRYGALPYIRPLKKRA